MNHIRDKKRWWAVHCCRQVIVPPSLPVINLAMVGLVMLGMLFALAALHATTAAGGVSLAMATLTTKWPTLLDLTNRMDPDGSISGVAEIVDQKNEVVQDMLLLEGNLPTGHQTTVRTGIPAPTWRKLYGGVQPTKSTTTKIVDTCGMLEAYAEVDKALADLNGNTTAFRLSEDKPHIEGISEEFASNLFYGDEKSTPERFTGFAPRFNDATNAENKTNIVKGDGAGSTNTSIWLVNWGPDSVYGIYPKGSKAGLQVEDKGQVTIENADGAGGRMEAYRTHYRWDVGLCVRDWRHIVRICNIDVNNLTKDASAGSDLVDLLTQAIEICESLENARFYCNRRVRGFLRRQMVAAIKQSTLTFETVNGPDGRSRRLMVFDEIPIMRCDAILNTEATVA